MIGGLNLFGYVYPLLNLFWTVLIFFGVALMFFFIRLVLRRQLPTP